MEIIRSIIEKLKIKEVCGIVFIASLFISFMPNELAEKMGLQIIRIKYQSVLSGVIVCIGAFYIYFLIEKIARFIKLRFFGIEHTAKHYLKNAITDDEKMLLIEKFYDKQKQSFVTTGYIDLSDGRKAALEYKGILYRSSSVSSYYTQFSYNLQPYALKILNDNVRKGNIVIEDDRYKFSLS